MATTFKALTNNDLVNSKTLLHEHIPITGSILSGTYGIYKAERNVRTYSHGMFTSIYDYPHLSSSSNHLFDITVGLSANSALSASSGRTQLKKKINIYNQMAQVLMGHESTGSAGVGVVKKVREFDEDGDLTGGNKLTDVVFFNFSRMLTKDEIKKGTFSMEFGLDNPYNDTDPFLKRVKVRDISAEDSFFVNSPAGEYGLLIATSSAPANLGLNKTHLINDTGSLANGQKVGIIFYQAGVAVLSSSLFLAGGHSAGGGEGGILRRFGATYVGPTSLSMSAAKDNIKALYTGSTIETMTHEVRRRIYNISFQNTTELHSTIYFCRLHSNDFNYSTNPTYLSGSKIRVKTNATDMPVSYLTTIGLYGSNNELLATAKLSEPLKKTPQNELTLRVRLDY